MLKPLGFRTPALSYILGGFVAGQPGGLPIWLFFAHFLAAYHKLPYPPDYKK